ncbi:MAG TPA: hypothetical protein VFC14_04310 [Burkholderiales bacterium]|nr:hypothetical protein [Burkholderiales bacterium]
MQRANDSSSARYATSFSEKLFGMRCEVEVVVDLTSGQPTSHLSMMMLMSSRPVFVISLLDLRLIARAIQDLKHHASLLTSRPDEATDHQLNYCIGGASVILVQPSGKPARFTLSIGTFQREGVLAELDMREIEHAIARIETLEKRVLDRIPRKDGENR